MDNLYFKLITTTVYLIIEIIFVSYSNASPVDSLFMHIQYMYYPTLPFNIKYQEYKIVVPTFLLIYHINVVHNYQKNNCEILKSPKGASCFLYI